MARFVHPLFAIALASVAAHAGTPELGPPPHAVDAYGDPLPDGAVARIGSLRLRHGNLTDFALLADGTILTAGRDRVVRWWDGASGRQLRSVRLQENDGEQFPVILSANGRAAAVVKFSVPGGARIETFETESGRQTGEFELPTDGLDIAVFRPDGAALAVGSHILGQVRLIDIPTGRATVRKFGGRQLSASLRLQFSENGRRLAVGGLDRGSELRVLEGDTLEPVHVRPGSFVARALSADGKRMALAETVDEPPGGVSVAIVDLEVGKARDTKPLRLPIDPDERVELALSADGTMLACFSRSSGVVVDLRTGNVRFRIRGGAAGPRFNADGSLLAAHTPYRMRLWDPRTGQELHDRPGLLPGGDYTISPDGRILTAQTDTLEIGIWRPETNSPFSRLGDLYNPGDETPRFGYSAEMGRLVVYAGRGALHLWKPDSWPRRQSVPLEGMGRECYSLVSRPSPDGSRFAAIVRTRQSSESDPAELRVWDTADGRLRRRVRVGAHEASCFWLDDGTTVHVGLNGSSMRLDDATGQITRGGDERQEGYPADCRLLGSVSSDKVEIREAVSGNVVMTAPGTNAHAPRAAVAPRFRAALRATRIWIKVYDLVDGSVRGVFDLPDVSGIGQFDPVVSDMRVLPGDRYVLTSLRDGTALVWDLARWPSPRPADDAARRSLKACWDGLRDADAARAFAVGWEMYEHPPADVVAFLRPRLRPAARIDAGDVRRWIGELDSPRFAVREAASRRLEAAGPAVLVHLRNPPAGLSAEAIDRVRRLIELMSNPVAPPDVLQFVRALGVLERVNTPEARRLVAELADGAPGAPETTAARALLVRIGR